MPGLSDIFSPSQTADDDQGGPEVIHVSEGGDPVQDDGGTGFEAQDSNVALGASDQPSDDWMEPQ